MAKIYDITERLRQRTAMRPKAKKADNNVVPIVPESRWKQVLHQLREDVRMDVHINRDDLSVEFVLAERGTDDGATLRCVVDLGSMADMMRALTLVVDARPGKKD